MRTVFYEQVKEDIKRKIVLGEYTVGMFLPAEKKLAEHYEMSLITIRRSIDELVQEGFLQKKIAKGALVISNQPMRKIAKGQQFTEILQAEGVILEKSNLSYGFIASDLFPTQDQTLCIERHYVLDTQVFILERHFFATSIGGQFPTEKFQATDSIYQYLYALNIEFSRFSDHFKAIFYTEEIQKKLQTVHQIGLERKRVGYDQHNKIVHIVVSIYDTDVHPYIVQFDI